MLEERITTLQEGADHDGPVVYWMSRDQRVRDNWALIAAQELALSKKVPLAVLFCLVPSFLDAAMRQYAFMLSGLKEVQRALSDIAIPFFVPTGDPGAAIPDFVNHHGVSILVTDFDPLRIKREWKRDVAGAIAIPFLEVDAHNIVPCTTASQKAEYGAYTIRKKIRRALPRFLDEFPPLVRHPFPWHRGTPPIAWNELIGTLKADGNVSEVDWITPGEVYARNALDQFISGRLSDYDTVRNDPARQGQSDLSPYLHFGHISAQRVALEAMKSNAPDTSRDAFLEELIIRRELSDNFCFHNPFYDRFEGFPGWAKATLNTHRRDRRPYFYSRDEFENSETHDDLWNAAQEEMVKRGKMHGYMRMYWAKKILEWTPSPEEAVATAIHLNDKYDLDGRDPNGYAGIAWSIGGTHDRPWNERPIFGKIRYMSYNGCKSKFSIKKYIEYVEGL